MFQLPLGEDSYLLYPEHHKSLRFLLQFEEAWRPIFFIDMGDDGSIYLGPSDENAKGGGAYEADVTSDGKILIRKETEENPLKVSSKKSHEYISLHSSGLIRSSGRPMRFFPTQDLRSSVLIGSMILPTLINFPSLTKYVPRKTDIQVTLSEDPAKPISIVFFLGPGNNTKISPYFPPDATERREYLLQYPEITNKNHLMVQVVFFRGKVGKWSEQMGLLVPTEEGIARIFVPIFC
jgi:hypothetical protein